MRGLLSKANVGDKRLVFICMLWTILYFTTYTNVQTILLRILKL
jgi:hypothetical protein